MNRRTLMFSAGLLCAGTQAAQAQPQPVTPMLSGQTLDGKPYDLAQDAGKVVMVFFWSTGCAVCRDKMPELRANYEAWRQKAFQLVAVSLDKTIEDLQAYERVLSGVVPPSQRFPSVWRGAAGHRDSFGAVPQTPTSFLLDRKGNLVKQMRGRIAPQLWDDVAELVLT
jgi:thiol-disulfide isomerase/thioredoxin